jgi:hypothetical protein
MVNHYLTPGAIIDSSHIWDEIQTFADSTALAFGTGSDSKIYFDGTDTYWDLRATGTGDLMIALGGSFPAPDPNAVHIWRGSAGVVDASTSSVLILESNGDAVLQILTPNVASGKILFGSLADRTRGTLEYFGSTDTPADTMRMRVGGNIQFNYTAGALAFAPETTISTSTGALTRDPTTNVRIGGTAVHGTTVGTNALSIFNGTAPAGTLANGASIYSEGGVMKVINADGSGGTIDYT